MIIRYIFLILSPLFFFAAFKKNRFIGYRTSSSLKNSITWKSSNFSMAGYSILSAIIFEIFYRKIPGVNIIVLSVCLFVLSIVMTEILLRVCDKYFSIHDSDKVSLVISSPRNLVSLVNDNTLFKEAIIGSMFLFALLIIGSIWNLIPKNISMHYDFTGKPSNMMRKEAIFLLLVPSYFFLLLVRSLSKGNASSELFTFIFRVFVAIVICGVTVFIIYNSL